MHVCECVGRVHVNDYKSPCLCMCIQLHTCLTLDVFAHRLLQAHPERPPLTDPGQARVLFKEVVQSEGSTGNLTVTNLIHIFKLFDTDGECKGQAVPESACCVCLTVCVCVCAREKSGKCLHRGQTS